MKPSQQKRPKQKGFGSIEKFSLIAMIILLVMAVYVRNGVDTVTDDAEEMVQTSQHLSSSNTLREILITLTHRYANAESDWQGALNFLLVVVVLTIVVTAVLLVRCHNLGTELENLKRDQTRR